MHIGPADGSGERGLTRTRRGVPYAVTFGATQTPLAQEYDGS